MKSPRRPQNTQKALFARQMKQYETTKPIYYSPKPKKHKNAEKN